MGENPASKRNYAREYANWKKRPHAMDIQYDRVKARRAMVKEYGKEFLRRQGHRPHPSRCVTSTPAATARTGGCQQPAR